MWNTAVVLLTVLIALFAVREGLRFYLLRETDEILDAEAKELLLAVDAYHNDRPQVIAEMMRKAEAHEKSDWFIRWLDSDRTDLWKSDNVPTDSHTRLQATIGGHDVWGSKTHRSVEVELNKPGLPRQYVRVGTPILFVEEDVNRLTRILAPIGLAIFILAPLGGLLLAERAIEPLQQIIYTTERLRPSHLDERLHVRGVGDELDQLATKINTFLDVIALHLQKNRDFVANAAHELRSPLTAIQSLVEVTLDKHRTPAEYEELLFQINDECRHLAQVVNQLLQLTQSEANAADTRQERIQMDELVTRALEMFEPVAEERQVSLSSSLAELYVTGNPRELRQLLTNLIDNAIKFTPPGGNVDVSLARDNNQQVRLVVRDTGIGIPTDAISRVFDRFYQEEGALRRSAGGTGLGLAICRQIVNGWGGEIWAESRGKNNGSQFHFTIPIFKDKTNDNPPNTAPKKSSRRPASKRK